MYHSFFPFFSFQLSPLSFAFLFFLFFYEWQETPVGNYSLHTVLNCTQSECQPVMEELRHQLHLNDHPVLPGEEGSKEPSIADTFSVSGAVAGDRGGSRLRGTWNIPAP